MKNNLCIIPARGGSKRIPRKNIREFLGKPIIAYSIMAALESNLFNEVMVSTDDDEIASLALEFGAEVPFRRSDVTAGDHATTMDVMKEVLKNYSEIGKEFDNFCCIYPTAPFVTAKTLVSAFDLMETGGFDTVLPVMKYSFPVQRSFSSDSLGKLEYRFPQFKDCRSQDLDDSFHDAGQFYFCRSSITTGDSIITQNTGKIILTDFQGQDIDTEMDWKLAEFKYGFIQSFN